MIVERNFLSPGHPAIVGKEFAEVECGCKVLFGVRIDRQEPATGATPCCAEHRQMMEEFTLRLKESLVEPTERLAIEVIDEILTKLYDERTGEDARRHQSR